MRALPPRLAVAEKPIKDGTGRQAQTVGVDNEWFWADSVCRPHFADNIAAGWRFYNGFARLLSDREVRQKVSYEQAGLRDLVAAEADRDTSKTGALLNDNELDFIRAYHRAVQMARGKIKAETMGRGNTYPANPATKNRWNRLMERLRLELIGAKTEAQARNAVSETFARSGVVRELQDDDALGRVHALMFGGDWQRLRDLALLALASYRRRPKPGTEDQPAGNAAGNDGSNL